MWWAHVPTLHLRFSCRFARSLVVFFKPLTGSKVVGQAVANERPEIETLTSVSSKCKEQVLGSTRFFNFFVGSFTEDHPLSSLAVVFRKSKEREIWSIMSAISPNSHSTLLYHGNGLSKSTEDEKNLTEIFRD